MEWVHQRPGWEGWRSPSKENHDAERCFHVDRDALDSERSVHVEFDAVDSERCFHFQFDALR